MASARVRPAHRRQPRFSGRLARRVALPVVLALGLLVAVPLSGVPVPGGFPLAGLWSWLRSGHDWPSPDVPRQWSGTAAGKSHYVDAAATDAAGGRGRSPRPAPGTLPAYQPHDAGGDPRGAPALPVGFDARTSVRVASGASAGSDLYRNADGTYTRKVYQGSVNYPAADGSWQPIDPTLHRAPDGRLHMGANSLKISVAGTSGPTGALASMSLPTGETASYDLAGAAGVTPQVSGGTATYQGILADTNLELSTSSDGLKESLVLTSPDAPSTWVFPLRLSGLTPSLTKAGAVELRNASGTPVAWIPPGFMEDSKVDPKSGAPAQSGKVTYELVTVDGQPALKVSADSTWLHDKARVYPVRVDPTTMTYTTGDVFVDNTTDTTNHNGDNLPVGTYNGGSTKARSFIHLDEFDDDGLTGKRIASAKLHLFHTWSSDCNTHLPFNVHRVTEKWTVADLTSAAPSVFPGPSVSSAIGSLTISDNAPACNNDAADRSVGKWWAVPLNVATFNDWSSGGTNYGIALTASETNSYSWKRFDSANALSGAYRPYLELTYADNVKPQVDTRYPANNSVTPTLTPELLVRAHDPDAYPNKGLTYNFIVTDATSGTSVANSGWVSTPSWTVPAGKLAWNKTYLYTVQVYDKVGYSAVYPAYAFTTAVPQPLLTSNLAQNAGKGFDPSVGNYTTTATDASVASVGPALEITRSYNSLDLRRDNVFGAGWSSLLDSRAVRVVDANGSPQSVVITYPTGADIAFGRNANGTFTPPAGRFATLVETKDAAGALTGYTLTDKDATVYRFAQPIGSAAAGGYKITSIADANGRALTFTYAAAGTLTMMTSEASGRSLHFTWTTPDSTSWAPHVASVSTDPVTAGGEPMTWTYAYTTDDRLTSVCPPGAGNQCVTYTFGSWLSQYANAVLNANPYSYWRLAEPAGSAVAASSVLSNAGVDNGRYNAVTLGQAAPFSYSTATSAGFNGTSSYVQLPGKLVTDGQYQSISMWFKTTAVNGVLFSYTADPISKGSTASNYVPALYIGSDGKLRGEFWQGAATPITSSAAVNDGAWHHVVLAGAGDTQTLYLDGVARGSLAGTIALFKPGGSSYSTVGAGFVGDAWPMHANTGKAPAPASYFNGSVADVAFFNQALTGSTVSALYKAAKYANPTLTRVTRPSGGDSAVMAYDTVTGKLAKLTDENGGTWTMGTPTVSGSSDVYEAAVLGAKPADYWRMAEVSVTDAVNEVQGGQAVYSGVTLGAAGPFTDATAASFNGTSAYVELPADDVPTTGPNSVEMWFKMPSGSTAGGVLYSYQTTPLADIASLTGAWVPALYVGADGKLRGQFWNGKATPITTTGKVNDGKWHHVALAAGTTGQKLYLDGAAVGTLAGAMVANTAAYAYVGAGAAKNWASPPANAAGYFPGSMAEVAFYGSELSAEQVAAHYQASRQAAPVAITVVSGAAKKIAMPVSTVSVTGPTGEQVSYTYDVVNGSRPVAQTDGLGNVTRYGYDVGGYSSIVYDPRGVWTQNLQDARGNTKQTITCQDQAANVCSSVYFTYFPDATTTTLTPDARNDVLLSVRDGRSASETDNTYLTSYGYDAKGNRTTVTDPLGRVTTTAYTDGTTVAAADSGFAPPGLPAVLTTAGGAVQKVTYYASGDVAAVTDPAGKVTRYRYDKLGRVLTATETTDAYPQGLTTSYRYDARGRLASMTEPPVTNRVTGAVHTAVTTPTYDPDGNKLAETIADTTGGDASRTQTWAYNERGQQVSETDEVGKTTSYTYNLYGQVVSETASDGGVVTSAYDVEGNLLTTTMVGYTGDPNNPSDARDVVLTSKAYDPAGRLASETDAMGYTTRYTYTDNGLTASVTRTGPGSGESFVVERNTYDAAGNVVNQVTNDGATTTTYSIDAAGRTASSTLDPSGLARTTSFTYSPDDNVLSETASDPSGVLSYSETMYDPLGEPLAETVYVSDGAPVGRWKLAETTGTTAKDSAGNSPATVNGAVTWSDEHGGSAVFGGGGSQLVTDAPVVDTTRSFTVAAWVKLAAADSKTRKAVSATGNRQDAFDLRYDDSNTWKFVIKPADVDDTTASVVATGTTTPAPNTWTHLVGVYDQQAGNIKLYVNGALEATRVASKPFPALGPIRIGGGMWNGSIGERWLGSISDTQLYSRALSATEVAAVRAGTAPAANASVVRTSYTVDNDGLLTSMTDPNGETTLYEYDEAGRPSVTIEPPTNAERPGENPVLSRSVTTTGYDTFGAVTETRDANGDVTVTEYDAAGRPAANRQPAYTPPGGSEPIRAVSRAEYDDLGQVVATTDPLGRVTRYGYDQFGQVATVTAANGGRTTSTYDLLGRVSSSTDPNGARITATYDYLGRKATTTDVVRQSGASYTTRYGYGPGGWLSSVTTPAGVTASTSYNAAGEPVAVTDGAGNVTRTGYDGLGRAVRSTMPDGSYSTVTYDRAGRATATGVYDPSGTTLAGTTSRYDRTGNVLAETDARGTTTTFGYDATGLLVSQTEPISEADSITSTFGYDVSGQQVRFTDGRGNSFLTTYNSWGLPESQIEPPTSAYPDPADRTFTVSYDAAGHPVSMTAPGGVRVDATFDDLGNLKRQTGTGAEVTTTDRAFEYDPGGRLVSATASAGAVTFGYDDRGLLTTVDGAAGKSSFTYTADGEMASRADAAGTMSYGYDTAGRLASVSNTSAGLAATLTYNSLSQVATVNYAAGGNTRYLSYDARHRLVGDEVKTASGSSIGKIEYGWDANGNEIRKKTTGFAGSADNSYTYDLANRLTSWNNGSATTAYAYDKSGNRVQAGPVTFTYDARNQLQTQTGGSTVTAYSYTPRGTLREAASGSSKLRTKADAFNQVVAQDYAQNGQPAGTREYRYDGLGRVVLDGFSYSGTGNTLASDGAVGYLRDTDDDLFGVASGGSGRLMWTDLHDDVVGQFTSAGTGLAGSVSYDPLGKVLAKSGIWGNLGYQSEWTDELTGRVNMAARWYNTDTGQFDTRDTAPASPVGDSVAANRFAYGDDNPLTTTDPTGHWGWRSVWNGVKSVASRVTHAVTSAYSAASYYGSYYAAQARSYASRAYHAAKTTVKRAAKHVTRTVKRAYHAAKRYVKKAAKAVKRAVHKGRKWVAHKAHQLKHKVVKAAHKIRQAGKHALAKAVRTAKSAGSKLKDAAKATGKWVKEHKALIIEVAAIGAGIVAGLACTAATAGAGAVACMVGASALINLAKDAAQGNIHDLGDALGSLGTGALQGALGGAAGAVGGKVAGVVATKLGGAAASLGGRMLVGGVESGVADAITQYATTGRVDPGGLAFSVALGAATSGRSRGGRGSTGSRSGGLADASDAIPDRMPSDIGSGPSCPLGHSFTPDTKVVMADGSTRAIKDVNVGDTVLATDPATGRTSVRAVTMLHINTDTDLTDVTVTATGTGNRDGASTPTASSAANTADAGTADAGTAGTTRADASADASAAAGGGHPAQERPDSSISLSATFGKVRKLLATATVAAGLALGASTVLHTTAHHPFWDETTGGWVNAAELSVGHELRTLDGAIVTVTGVQTRTGTQTMRDLTVDGIHTYFVVAGDTPVLVHNCNTVSVNDAGRFGDLSPGPVGDGLTAHHMPQDALGFAPRNEGGAIVVTLDDHKLTRTYGAKGAVTKAAEAGMSFRDVLARDIRDLRRIGESQHGDPGYFNKGIQGLLAYYRKTGQL